MRQVSGLFDKKEKEEEKSYLLKCNIFHVKIPVRLIAPTRISLNTTTRASSREQRNLFITVQRVRETPPFDEETPNQLHPLETRSCRVQGWVEIWGMKKWTDVEPISEGAGCEERDSRSAETRALRKGGRSNEEIYVVCILRI